MRQVIEVKKENRIHHRPEILLLNMGKFSLTLKVLVLLAAELNGGIIAHGDEPFHVSPSKLSLTTRSTESNNNSRFSSFSGQHYIPLTERKKASVFHCRSAGLFAMKGSCRGFYQCRQLTDSSEFLISFHICPVGKIFDDISATCVIESKEAPRTECIGKHSLDDSNIHQANILPDTSSVVNERVNNVRVVSDMILGESLPTPRVRRHSPGSNAHILSHGTFLSVYGENNGANGYLGGEAILDKLENKLTGLQGRLHGESISMLQSQIARKVFTKITEVVSKTKLKNVQRNFDSIQNLIQSDMLEDTALTAVLHNMVKDESILDRFNLAEVKVTLKEMEQYIKQIIVDSKNEVNQGFEMVSNLSGSSAIEPLVSKFLNLTVEVRQKLYRLQSLPVKEQEMQIEGTEGLYDYLQLFELQTVLNDITDNGLAIPNNASDIPALITLDLLIHGLQTYTNFLSFTVSSNIHAVQKSFSDMDFEVFSIHIQKLETSLNRVKSSLGYKSLDGLLSKVSSILDEIEQLSFAPSIESLVELLREKRISLSQVTSDVDRLIEGNIIEPEPETLSAEMDFSASNISLPIGQWKKGKHVSYAIQTVSRNGLSKISEWSKFQKIQDKAHPILHVPVTDTEEKIRLIYRKFDQSKPELIAILPDSKLDFFRDIDRDLINAASDTKGAETEREVRDLLDDGADINCKLENYMTPLHYAAKYGNVDIMEVLVSAGADVNPKSLNNEEPLHIAAFYGNKDAIDYLVIKGANVNAQTKLAGWSPLHIAVANNHAPATNALLTANASLSAGDTNGMTPLHLAMIGDEDTLNTLLSSDDTYINVLTKGRLTPLHIAAAISSEVFMQTLLSHRGIDIDPTYNEPFSPLHLAAIHDNIEAITSLIHHGLPANVTDEDGSTPLHYASFYGNLKSVLVLIQIDPSLKNMTNDDDKTPLHIAIENKRDGIVKVLKNDIFKISNIIVSELQDQNNKNIDQITTTCSREDLIEQMVSNSGDICSRISIVDEYITLVKFMIPIHIYFDDLQIYSQVIESFNSDLKAAQVHAKLWREDDSIFHGIRQTFKLAKEFEPEFSRKYAINHRHIEAIKRDVTQVDAIKKVKERITALEEDISQHRTMLDMAKNPSIKMFLNTSLTRFQSKLDQMQHKLTEDFTIMLELKELVEFLEFVREDVTAISVMALTIRGKTEEFIDYLHHDRSAFERHGKVAIESLARLQEERVRGNETLANIKAELTKLENKIEADRQRVWDLEVQIQDSHKELRQMRWKLIDNIGNSRTQKLIGAILTPFLVGIPLLVHASIEEKQYINTLKAVIKDQDDQVDLLRSQIETKGKEMVRFREMIADSKSDADQIPRNMHQLSMIDLDFKTIHSNSRALESAIEKALVGVTIVKQVFDGVSLKLDEMIRVAQTAGDAAARLNARYFIYNEISVLKCNWDDVYFHLMNIEKCTRNGHLSNLL